MTFPIPGVNGGPQIGGVSNPTKQNKSTQFSNITTNNLAQCKIVVYPWKNGLGDPNISDSALSEATRLDISSQITSCSFSKNTGSAAGNFSFSLTSSPGIGSQDWKDILKRGYWCIIYMANDGSLALNPIVGSNLSKNKKKEARYIRCIGYIETVGVKGTVGENKEIDIEYEVTGRDFGIVYEESNAWHNLFQYDQIMLQSIRDTQMNITGNVRIHTAIDLIHDLFFFPANIPGAKVNNNKSLLDIGLQWLLPKEMCKDIGFNLTKLGKGTYWGNLPRVKDIHQTGFGIAVDRPTDFLSGNPWDQLKKISIPQLHELFCETRLDGTPRMVFRPIPWAINQQNYSTVNSKYILKYIHLKPKIHVPGVDLIEFDLKEDDHSRYNSFLATVSTGLINTEDNIGLLKGTEFPKQNRASIRRHGFRPMHITVDSIVKNEQLANGSADFIQLKEANYIMYDYWNPAIFCETGHIEKVGSNDVKIGIALGFGSDVPYMTHKRYYVEGYQDTFQVEDNASTHWVQSVSLTRGMDERDLKKGGGFGNRHTAFTAPGEYTKRNSSGG